MSEQASSGHGAVPVLRRPLSTSVRRVLRLSASEARRYNHSFIGNEHLALAIHDAGGRAAAALDRLGLRIEALRAAVAHELGEGEQPPAGDPLLNARAERALAFASEEARRAARTAVGMEHLLLGLARDECLFGGVLARMGLETEKVREALRHPRLSLAPRYADARAEAAAIIDAPLASVQRAQRTVQQAVENALRRGQRELAERLRTTGDALQEIAERLSTASSTVEPG